jgi:HSP20 family molecular chaperone IbpA
MIFKYNTEFPNFQSLFTESSKILNNFNCKESQNLSHNFNFNYDDKSMSINIDVPGTLAQDIDVELQSSTVVKVLSTRKMNNSLSNYSSKHYIPEVYDTENIKATLENGVLTLLFLKKDKSNKTATKIKITQK